MNRYFKLVACGILFGIFAITTCVAQNLLDAKIYDQFLGTYQFSFGELLVIGRSQSQLYYHEPHTGQTRALTRGDNPQSETEWFAGPSLLVYTPVEFRISFIKNKAGKITGLSLKRSGVPDRIAKKASLYREERVSFRSGDVTLGGTLLLPATTKAPHPAAVFVHGSGSQSRNGYASLIRFAADHFARHGIAALIYDKRGVGESTGSWEMQSFNDLAGDVLAAHRFLQNRADINPKQVGLWGSSQAGWIMPVAASQSKDIAFIICVSCAGAGSTVGEQVLYSTEIEMRNKNTSQEEINEVLNARKLFYDYIHAGKGFKAERLDADVRKLRLNEKTRQWSPPLSSEVDWKKRDSWYFVYGIDFDALPLWEKYNGPVLGVFAELDALTSMQQVVPVFAKTLASRSNTDFTITVFPKAHHIIMEMEKSNPDDDDIARVKRYVPGYFDSMTDWLLKRVNVIRSSTVKNLR